MVSARCTKSARGSAGMAVRATSREEMELVCIGLLNGDAEPCRDDGVGRCGTSQSAAACAVAGVDPALKNLPMGFLKAKRAWRTGTPQRSWSSPPQGIDNHDYQGLGAPARRTSPLSVPPLRKELRSTWSAKCPERKSASVGPKELRRIGRLPNSDTALTSRSKMFTIGSFI